MPETIAAQRCPACSGDSVAGGLAVRENMFGLCERVGASVVSVDDDSTAFQFWGSEQYLRGIPLMGARSVMVKPGDASFSKAQLRSWEQQAVAFNKTGRGDQAAWVIGPDRT